MSSGSRLSDHDSRKRRTHNSVHAFSSWETRRGISWSWCRFSTKVAPLSSSPIQRAHSRESSKASWSTRPWRRPAAAASRSSCVGAKVGPRGIAIGVHAIGKPEIVIQPVDGVQRVQDCQRNQAIARVMGYPSHGRAKVEMARCSNHVVRGARLHDRMIEPVDQRFEPLGSQFDDESEQIAGRGVERLENQVQTMAVELAEGLQPSFAFNGLSRNPYVGGIGPLETGHIEHVVAIAELLQDIERGFHKRVDLLARPDGAYEWDCHLGIDRPDGPNFRLFARGPHSFQNHDCNRFLHVGLEPNVDRRKSRTIHVSQRWTALYPWKKGAS